MNKLYCTYLTFYKGNKLPPFYIGSSSVKKILSGYKGSVASLKWKDIWIVEIKNNPHLFRTQILKTYTDRKEASINERKLQKKLKVVRSSMYINQSICAPNGFCGMDVAGKNNPNYGNKKSQEEKKKFSKNSAMRGKIVAIDVCGQKHIVSTTDERLKTGELVHHLKGKKRKSKHIIKDHLPGRDNSGNTYWINRNDERYKSGEIVHYTKGYKTVIEIESGNKIRIKISEFNPRIHQPLNKNIMQFVDAIGNKIKTSVDDIRVKNGELVPFSKGKVTVKNNIGEIFSVAKNDPRYLSGELVHHTKGTVRAYDAVTGTSLGRISKLDPRWSSGDIIYKRNKPK